LFERPEIRFNCQKNVIHYLISGKNETIPQKEKEYFHCYTARMIDIMCGLDGKKYEKKL